MFDPVSYLMGKKSSGGGGGGSSIANALQVTMTPNQDYTEVTTDFTAGQIAEFVDTGRIRAYTDIDGTPYWFMERSEYRFTLYSYADDYEFLLTASSADSNVFVYSPHNEETHV